MSYTLSTDQAAALQEIGRWYKGKTKQYITLGGYAGTGKTTLIAYLRQALTQHDEAIRVAFCAFTGKATRVLETKLKDHKVMRRGDSISTIHALIYSARLDDEGGVRGWERKAKLDYELIIVDEASMVDEAVWQDLLSFDVPILAVGDHGQLPPINSNFNLMAEPMIRLERIYRQAAGSPIIELATQARLHGRIAVGDYGDGVRKISRYNHEGGEIVQEMLEAYSPELLILCGYNSTRNQLNAAVRGYKDFALPAPAGGDRVVCLRNNRTSNVYNGMTGTIRSIYGDDSSPDSPWYYAQIELDNETFLYHGYVFKEGFAATEQPRNLPLNPEDNRGDLFDFGYALTVHKAQGSQAPRVLLFEERFPKMSDEDWRRWLYTAVTRASQRLTIVGYD